MTDSIDTHLLFIGAIFFIFVIAAGWHLYENKTLARRWPDAPGIVRMAWARSAQLLLALASLLALAIHNWQLEQPIPAPAAQTIAAAATPPPAPAQPVPAQPAAPPPATIPPAAYYPPLAPSSPAPVQSVPEAEAVSLHPEATALDDLYNPEKTHNDRQSAMDSIKKRYEDIIVTYLFLDRCGKTKPEEYGIIAHALMQEAALVKAPPQLPQDIVASAQGSYKEIYARSRCDDRGIAALYNQYTDYLKALAANFPAK